MIVMVVAAVLGAALGLFVRPWMLAPAIATTLAAAVQGGMMFVGHLLADKAGQEKAVILLGAVAGTDPMAILPTAAAAGVAALLSALLCSMADGDGPQKKFWIPQDGDARGRDRNGRLRRLPGMVEERDVHARSESRFHAILDK